MADRTFRRTRVLLAAAAVLAQAPGAMAQLVSLGGIPSGPSGNADAPVTFLADQVSYDKTGEIVTAAGHVRAFQNGQTLYADKVVINRVTNQATASGDVVLTQQNGPTVFADHAVLSKGMKDAVMNGVGARLAMNGKMAANGARRTDGVIDELAKVVYSPCNLCKRDPTAPPLWQIRASLATRDYQHKRIEYRDATMEIEGIPVFYFPYMSQPDPSVKRQTGLLIPSIGSSSHLGFFTAIPYYIVLDPESDITLTPIIAAKQGPAIDGKYRRDFNDGELNIDASIGHDHGSLGDSVFSNGTFDINDSWRAGFSFNRASNPGYLNDFNILPNASFLASDVYAEGFSPGAYFRLDADTYQGLVSSITQSELPVVLPHAQYNFNSDPDWLGGRYTLNADVFNLYRNQGTDTRRAEATGNYDLPLAGPLGQRWEARVEVLAAGYNAGDLNQQPNFSVRDDASTGRAQPYGALFMRWPFIRSAGGLGSQIIEPEAQFVASPVVGTSDNYRIPNEDSLDLEYSDANLFDFNRYPGVDRIEGGSRVDYAMHAAWYLPNGMTMDGLLGQSYRFHKDGDYLPESGLNDNASDIVGRVTLAPSSLFSLTYRTRLSHNDLGRRMIDATAKIGDSHFNLSGGYLYTNTNPYTLYNQATIPAAYYTPRHEATVNANAAFGQWSLSAGVERNLQTGMFDDANAAIVWQNECTAVSVNYYRRFTSFNLDNGSTTLLFQITFKTLGNIGFNAL